MNNIIMTPDGTPIIMEGHSDMAYALQVRQDFEAVAGAKPARDLMTRQYAEQLIRAGLIPEHERESFLESLDALFKRQRELEHMLESKDQQHQSEIDCQNQEIQDLHRVLEDVISNPVEAEGKP